VGMEYLNRLLLTWISGFEGLRSSASVQTLTLFFKSWCRGTVNFDL
jgi:hypothetical protein